MTSLSIRSLFIILRMQCVFLNCVFYNFCHEVGQLSGQQRANIITLFQFNSRMLVENCVVGICNSGMFLQFYELTFEMKYLAGIYKRH